MYDILLGALVLVTIFLGVRVFMKFRDISSWKSDDEPGSTIDRPSRSQGVGDLKIEAPPPDAFDSLDSTDHKGTPGHNPPPEND